MSRSTLSITPQLSDYISKLGVKESPIAYKLRQHTQELEYARMQIAPEQAHFMAFLAKMIKAKSYLEIGVFTGYSCLSIMEAIGKDGEAIACDISTQWTDIAKSYWKEAGLLEAIDLKIAPALETLETLSHKRFDLIFIDADKASYKAYYEKALMLLNKDGMIMIDNIFWNGDVADNTIQDEDTLAIRELNEHIASDTRVDATMVPIGDGLMLVTKI